MFIARFIYGAILTSFLSFTTALLCESGFNKHFTVMINPEGDARSAGRILNDCYERGITLQFAEKLKNFLEQINRTMRVVLTRIPGETLEPLQKANFANRLDPDVYISIHFYHEREAHPRIFLYHFLYDTFYTPLPERLTFYRFDDIHLINVKKTVSMGATLKHILQNEQYHKLFDLKGVYGIPFAPLAGIKSPAIAIEIGLKQSSDFTLYIEPIAQAIQALQPQESLNPYGLS